MTQAWCKLWECVRSYNVVSGNEDGTFRSVHLCEAPGAFVAALNHHLKTNFSELKVSLLEFFLN